MFAAGALKMMEKKWRCCASSVVVRGALQLRAEMVAHDGARFKCGGGIGRSVVAAVTGASSSWWLSAMVGHGGS